VIGTPAVCCTFGGEQPKKRDHQSSPQSEVDVEAPVWLLLLLIVIDDDEDDELGQQRMLLGVFGHLPVK
jgi:hypothetical protein